MIRGKRKLKFEYGSIFSFSFPFVVWSTIPREADGKEKLHSVEISTSFVQFSRKLLFIPLSYTEVNKGYVFHATISLILTPSSLCCVFAVIKRGKRKGGGYISLKIVVRLVITANEIFIEKFAAINLAPVIIFHLFDQRSVISSYDGAGWRGRDRDVSIIRQFPSSSSVPRVEIEGGGGGWKMANGEEDCSRRHD